MGKAFQGSCGNVGYIVIEHGWANPMIPRPKSANLNGSLTRNTVGNGSKVAAGPSTCGDW
jgi:hypothetical protein